MEKNKLVAQFFRYTGWNILGMLGFAFYVFVDTYYVAAAMGVQGLSALNQALPVYNFVFGICLMVAIGGGIQIGMCHSLKDRDGVRQTVTHLLVLALCFTLLFWLIAWQGMPLLMEGMGVDQEVYGWSYQYSQVMLLFSPMFMLNQIGVVAVRNEGQPRLAMIAMVAGSLFNVVADYFFIFTLNLGILGAALATGTAPLVGILVVLPYLLSGDCSLRPVPIRPRWNSMFTICQLGFSSLVLELSSGVVLILFNNLMLGEGGNAAVASYGVIANLSIVIFAIYTGIAQGIQPLCSHFVALEQERELKFILRMALGTALVSGVLIYMGLVAMDTPLVAIFNGQGDVNLQQMAEYGLVRYFLCLFFVGTNIVLAAYYSAIAHPNIAFVISTARGGLLLIPVALILSTAFGLDGIWLSMPVTECLTALVAVALLFTQEKFKLYPGCTCKKRKNELN